MLRNNNFFFKDFDQFLLSITITTTPKGRVAIGMLQRFVFILSKLVRVRVVRVKVRDVGVTVVRTRVRS